jgi:hypothetical protein
MGHAFDNQVGSTYRWGETQTHEIGTISRRVAGLDADEVGLLLDEAKPNCDIVLPHERANLVIAC